MVKKMTRTVCAFLAALLLFVAFALFAGAEEETAVSVKIVHTNDIHARVEENAKNGIIGLARVSGLKKAFTAGADLALTFDSGDLFHGQPIATLEGGMPISELIAAVGYDAVTAGNHDWSYGRDALITLGEASGAVMLTGNVETAGGAKFFSEEFLIKTVEKDGKTLKIGVFGVIDPKVTRMTSPKNIEGLTFEDPAAYAARAAAALREMGCGVVIALSHTYDPIALAKRVEGVDLWLCGHEHVEINEEVITDGGAKTYVLESGYYLYAVSTLSLDVTLDADGNVTNVSAAAQIHRFDDLADVSPDGEILSLLGRINARQIGVLGQKIGYAPVSLDGVWEHLRIGQTKLGRAVCEAYLLETGADVAFENAGGIRASVDAGEVTYKDVLGVSPYGNIIVTKKITGAQLREVLETALQIGEECIAANESNDFNAWPQSSGSYLQCAGVRLLYDPLKPAGQRILSLYVGQEECDPEKIYTVASNSFMMENAYYPALMNAEEDGEFRACEEVLADFFAQDEDRVSAALEGETFVQAETIPAGTDGYGVFPLLALVSLAAAAALLARYKKRRAL